MILSAILIGILAAIAKFITLLKLGQLKRLLAFDAGLDIAGGMIFAFLFFGTLTGMIIASFAGITFSGLLWLYKARNGYEKLALRNWRIVWVTVPPRWGRPATA